MGKELLTELWDYRLHNCNYDALNGIVTLLVERENNTSDIIKFIGVSAFLFLQNTENKFLADEYHELTYLAEEEIIIPVSMVKDKWLKQYAIDFNITMEFISSAVLIKAQKMVYDSIEYELILN